MNCSKTRVNNVIVEILSVHMVHVKVVRIVSSVSAHLQRRSKLFS